jgi:uncharacterized protein (TIGR02145 family)
MKAKTSVLLRKALLIYCMIFLFFSTGYAQIKINGVCWATCNVASPGTFAANPQTAGMFYQWGSNIGWSSTNPLTASDGINVWRILSDGSFDVWLPENDPCPAGWRVPTKEELDCLNSADNYWGNLSGVNGRFFGNEEPKLFLPAVGWRDFTSGTLYLVGPRSYYWSSTIGGDYYHPCEIFIQNAAPTVGWMGAYSFGNPVRCVAIQCDFEIGFYANDVHYSTLQDTTFCASYVSFSAETECLSPDSVRWYINGVEEIAARDSMEWGKNIPNGNHVITMEAIFPRGEIKTVSSTLKVFAPWIKIRNVRRE